MTEPTLNFSAYRLAHGPDDDFYRPAHLVDNVNLPLERALTLLSLLRQHSGANDPALALVEHEIKDARQILAAWHDGRGKETS